MPNHGVTRQTSRSPAWRKRVSIVRAHAALTTFFANKLNSSKVELAVATAAMELAPFVMHVFQTMRDIFQGLFANPISPLTTLLQHGLS